MGEYKEKNGTTRVGDFLRNIKGLAPDVLELAGNITGVEALEKLGDKIRGTDSLTETQKATALDLLKHDLENTKDARAMQVAALNQDDVFSKRFIYYLASFWSIMSVTYIFTITFFNIVNERVADTILGFLLGTIVATIINFFFGSSQSSKNKTEQMLNHIKK